MKKIVKKTPNYIHHTNQQAVPKLLFHKQRNDDRMDLKKYINSRQITGYLIHFTVFQAKYETASSFMQKNRNFLKNSLTAAESGQAR